MRRFLDIIHENEEEVRYWIEYLPSYKGQQNAFIQAAKGKRPVGYLDFSIYDGIAKIKMIEVADDCKRQGIATKMYDMLAQEVGGVDKIDPGYQTEDGVAFLGAMAKKDRST